MRLMLVDDDKRDVTLFRTAVEQSDIDIDLIVMPDGEACLDHLKRSPNDPDAPRPHVVLLDINMPRLTGHEVLAAMKADARLRSIPVVMFTTSDHETDVALAYAHNASSYIVKPSDFTQLETILATIVAYWGSTVRLPHRH